MTLTAHWQTPVVVALCRSLGVPVIARGLSEWLALGGRKLPGYQFRYIYFLAPDARQRLTVPILPFSKIEDMGAGMYLGEPVSRAKQETAETIGTSAV